MKFKNEIEQFCSKAIANSSTFNSINYSLVGNINDCKNVIDGLFNSTYFDHPDSFYYDKQNKILYIFEHFEFDCSSSNKKGSTLRRNYAEVVRKEKKIFDSSEDAIYVESILKQGNAGNNTFYIGANGDKYRDNYINNFTSSFQKHCSQIEGYKNDCIKKLGVVPEKYIITFVCEDITLYGTYYLDNKCNMGNPVNPLVTKQFMKLLQNSNVDYLIYKSESIPKFIILSKKFITDEIIETALDLKDKAFYIIPVGVKISSACKKTE